MRSYRIAARLLGILRAQGRTLSTAESLTGGLIAAALTAVPGSSDVFVGGVVSYAIEQKIGLLGVDPTTIERSGVVSEATAEAMARGALSVTGSTVAVAVTGVAGPGGGTDNNPVGTVCFAVASCGEHTPTSVRTLRCRFRGGRASVRRKTVARALSLVVSHLDSK